LPCGIAGFVGLSDKQLLERMLEVERHRGPDSTGTFLDANVGMGTDRLSIIDLEKGDQPIHNEDGTVWITFNGEVYNYIELRSSLERSGHRFYTASDTETVVHAYEEWGASCLARMRGMFAFAIWDANKKLLFCARDRFGKKPFYYALVGKQLLFGSELKTILQYGEFKREVDRNAMDHFFTYFYIPSPLTIFKGAYKLPPGHFLTYDASGLKVQQYWDMRFAPEQIDEGAAVEEIYRIISEAVRIRLRSDVPLGSFLSGGIDSSVVTSIMTKVSSQPVKTVTIGFEEEDEHIRYGRMVAEYLKIADPKEHIVEASTAEILPRLIWHFDEPFADSSFIPTYYLSEVMRREVKVSLSGDGGDEMFMGYPFLKDQPIYGIYSSLPKPLRKMGLKTILRLSREGEMKTMARHALEKRYDEQDYFGRYVMRTVVFTPETLSKLYGEKSADAPSRHPTLEFVRSNIDRYSSGDPLDAVNYATVKGYLSEMILTKVDRMSMAASLEARSPLLDQELAEYVGRLPSSLKYRGNETKYILKKMALEKELVPREVVERKKAGFGPPMDRWLGGEWQELTGQVLDKAAKVGFFDAAYLRRLGADPRGNASKIFGLTVFTLWHSQYIENPERNGPVRLESLI